jgi:hypothetical protein
MTASGDGPARGQASDGEVRVASRKGGRLVEPTLQALDSLDADALVVGICSDSRPLAGALGLLDWRMAGQLSRWIADGTITGALGEKILLPTAGKVPVPRVFLYGFGPAARATEDAAARVGGMLAMLEDAGCERVAVALPEPGAMWTGMVQSLIEKPLGARLAAVFAPDPVPPLPVPVSGG